MQTGAGQIEKLSDAFEHMSGAIIRPFYEAMTDGGFGDITATLDRVAEWAEADDSGLRSLANMSGEMVSILFDGITDAVDALAAGEVSITDAFGHIMIGQGLLNVAVGDKTSGMVEIIAGAVLAIASKMDAIGQDFVRAVDATNAYMAEAEAQGVELVNGYQHFGSGIASMVGASIAEDEDHWLNGAVRSLIEWMGFDLPEQQTQQITDAISAGFESVAIPAPVVYVEAPDVHITVPEFQGKGGGGQFSTTAFELGRGYATGLGYVPYDDFPALLHKGEAVLTKSDANDWRSGSPDSMERTLADLSAVMQRIESKLENTAVVMDGECVGRMVTGYVSENIAGSVKAYRW